MKKILMGLVAAACLTTYALPVFAQDAPKAEGEAKGKAKGKKAKGKVKKAEGEVKGAAEGAKP